MHYSVSRDYCNSRQIVKKKWKYLTEYPLKNPPIQWMNNGTLKYLRLFESFTPLDCEQFHSSPSAVACSGHWMLYAAYGEANLRNFTVSLRK